MDELFEIEIEEAEQQQSLICFGYSGIIMKWSFFIVGKSSKEMSRKEMESIKEKVALQCTSGLSHSKEGPHNKTLLI